MKNIESNPSKKIAVIHDWIFQRRGGERVLERILNLYPKADLYFLFGNPEKVLHLNGHHRFFPSFLNRIPAISKFYKFLLPFLPVAIESFDLSNYDLIISSSSCVAKGIIPPPQARHIAYIHSPMRYAWDQEHRYFKKPLALWRPFELLRRLFLNYLRLWDVSSSPRADVLIANSAFVARRCALYYGRTAQVIYPPVHVPQELRPLPLIGPKKILLFGAWVPYKKMFWALKFLVNQGYHVLAAGGGEEFHTAQQSFKRHPSVTFFASPSDAQVLDLYATAHVLLFPAIEDFGIIPVEAMASGIWVVAPRLGGTGETLIHGESGFLFEEGDTLSLLAALQKALQTPLDSQARQRLRQRALDFAPDVFDSKFKDIVQRTMESQNTKDEI